MLSLDNVGNAAARLDEDERISIRNPDANPARGNPNLIAVNESGLYSLILTSRKPAARLFKRWVTGEVLPAIRRSGRLHGRRAGRDARGAGAAGHSGAPGHGGALRAIAPWRPGRAPGASRWRPKNASIDMVA